MQDTVRQNACPQSAPAFQPFARPVSQHDIHPFARRGFFGAGKTNTLKFELATDEFSKIRAGDEHIAAGALWFRAREIEFTLQGREYVGVEERDLAFEIRAITKETIAPNPLPRDTFHFGDFDRRMGIRHLVVPPVVVVTRRDENVLNFHGPQSARNSGTVNPWTRQTANPGLTVQQPCALNSAQSKPT